MIAFGEDTRYIYVWAVVKRGKNQPKYTEIDKAYHYNKEHYTRSFTDADKKDDKLVVSDPTHSTILLKLKDVVSAENIMSDDGNIADKLAKVNKWTQEQLL